VAEDSVEGISSLFLHFTFNFLWEWFLKCY
jgi:hypothetical protein